MMTLRDVAFAVGALTTATRMAADGGLVRFT
jgi:hypothetical protein